jgi:flagellar protein FlgJ
MISGLPPLEMTALSPGMSNSKLDQMESSIRQGKLLHASQEFESYFLSYLMKVMRETVPKGALTANRMGEVFYSFYDEEIAQRAAQAGGIGLSTYVLAAVARNESSILQAASAPSSLKS